MRCINADALIADLMDRGVDQIQTDDFTEIVQAVQNAPTIEPERKMGEWITDNLSGLIYCGRCRNDAPMETTGGGQYKSNFCPNCGADMREGDSCDA